MKVGFLGTGLMGIPLAQRVLGAKIPVIAYNRTRAKLAPLQAMDAEIADTATQVIAEADCVILTLTDAVAIETLLLSEASRQVLAGRTVIQMGTIGIRESQQIRDQVVGAGGEYLEAPVLGSIPEAKAGTLIVMVGATSAQFERWLSLLQLFGKEPLLIGEVGSSAAVKLAMNQLIGSLTTAFALSLGLVLRSGVPVADFMKIVRDSALYAPTFDKKLQRMLERNYENPNFPTKHLLKDTALLMREGDLLGLDTQIQKAVLSVLEKTLELGLGDSDYSALFSAVNPED